MKERRFIAALAVLLGALLGALAGWYGSIAAMTLAGGGGSHDDLSTVVMTAFMGLVLGALAGPWSMRRALELRPSARPTDGGGSRAIVPLAYAGAFLAALFTAGTLLYYSLVVAEPSQVTAGAAPRLDPLASSGASSIGTRTALAGAITLGLAALFCVARALDSTGRRPRRH